MMTKFSTECCAIPSTTVAFHIITWLSIIKIKSKQIHVNIKTWECRELEIAEKLNNKRNRSNKPRSFQWILC